MTVSHFNNFHLFLIQLWLSFFQISVNGDLVNAIANEKCSRETLSLKFQSIFLWLWSYCITSTPLRQNQNKTNRIKTGKYQRNEKQNTAEKSLSRSNSNSSLFQNPDVRVQTAILIRSSSKTNVKLVFPRDN